MSKRPRGTGSISKSVGSENLWVAYTNAKGQYIGESCGRPKKTDAQNFLDARKKSVSEGNDPKRLAKVTVDELYDDLSQDYRIHGQDEEWAKDRWEVQPKDCFGGMKASRVGTAQIAEYLEKAKAREQPRRQSTGNWLCCAGLSLSGLKRSQNRFLGRRSFASSWFRRTEMSARAS